MTFYTTQAGWSHNRRMLRWEYFDNQMRMSGWITDEMIYRVENDILSAFILDKIESLPPPMENV